MEEDLFTRGRKALRALLKVGVLGGVGTLVVFLSVLSILFGVLPVIVVLAHDWPWFSPHQPFIMPAPASHPPVFWASVGLLVLGLAIRTVRRGSQGLPVGALLVAVVIGTGGWYLYAHTALGTAAYFIFTWLLGLGAAMGYVYGALAFLGGLAPGFLGAQGVMLYLVYHDPRLLTLSLLPAVVGELLDSIGGDVREKEEKA
jgi:hypothetical protein